jgi:hypothetical protein
LPRPGNRKTDWFNLTGARLQLRCYSRPTMELAVAAARPPASETLHDSSHSPRIRGVGRFSKKRSFVMPPVSGDVPD